MNIIIAGAGRVGSCLARRFAASGIRVLLWNAYPLDEAHRAIFSDFGDRMRLWDDGSPHRCETGDEELPSGSAREEQLRALPSPPGEGLGWAWGAPELLLLAVSDAAIPDVARLASGWGIDPSVPFLHCSGRTQAAGFLPPADPASGTPVRPQGAMHPAFAFPRPDLPLGLLDRVCFLLDGDPVAIDRCRALLDLCGLGHVIARGAHRALYHAGCVTASNLLAGLGMAAGEMFESAGIPEEGRLPLLLSLMEGVLAGARSGGFAGAATGPVARGDIETVLDEARELARTRPDLLPLFVEGSLALARLLGRPDVEQALTRALAPSTEAPGPSRP